MPLYEYASFFIYIFPLMDTWIIFNIWLLHVKMLQILLYMSSDGYMHYLLLNAYLGVELLSQRVDIYLALLDTAKEFSKVDEPIYPAISNDQNSDCSTSLSKIGIFQYLKKTKTFLLKKKCV